ncbi:MAG: hypothetical protein HYZ01_07825 [Ignavibacteriales bacterium]|nr:hypothetical protein [Ignavibacteriales bacterium]
MNGSETFPRDLASDERDLLQWVLPADRPGYRAYRALLDQWKVQARGRRGEGNYILAAEGERPDNESPLPQILALGMVETMEGNFSVIVRERLGDQVEFEIGGTGGRVGPGKSPERRRWTLSSWSPGEPCPACGQPLRETGMRTGDAKELSLAICQADKRLWIHDTVSGINHPIPVTNFYNELMLHKNIRDPKVALEPNRFFGDLPRYSDLDLTKAFITYNGLRTKIVLEHPIILPAPEGNLFLRRLKTLWNRATV